MGELGRRDDDGSPVNESADGTALVESPTA